MVNSLTELFLTNYFYIVTLVGNFLGGGKKLFYRLAKMFFMPNLDVEKFYNIVNSPELNEVDTLNKFNQRNRLLKYYELLGKESPLSPEYEEVIRIKGNVLSSLKGAPLEVSKKCAEAGGIQYLDFSNQCRFSECAVCVRLVAVRGNILR